MVVPQYAGASGTGRLGLIWVPSQDSKLLRKVGYASRLETLQFHLSSDQAGTNKLRNITSRHPDSLSVVTTMHVRKLTTL